MNRFWKSFVLFPACLALGATTVVSRCEAAPPSTGKNAFTVVITPENAFAFRFLKNGAHFGSMDMVGWGPNWSYAPPSKQGYARDGVLEATVPFMAESPINLTENVTESDSNRLTYKYTLGADKDRALTQLSNAFSFVGDYNSGTIDVTKSDGTKARALPIPTQLGGFEGSISKAVFHVKNVGDITAKFDPPLSPHVENNNLRMKLAHDSFPAGTKTETMTITFPGPVKLVADKPGVARYIKTLADAKWFEWKPANSVAPSAIGMESWLDGPAGKHGGVTIGAAGHLAFTDKTPVKFWGTNLAYTQNTPEKEQADLTAARFAKYGINCVRMHKFTSPGQGIGKDTTATDFDEAALDKLDYFTAQLKKRGVYYGWSHTFGFIARPGDKDKFLNYAELAALSERNTYGVINGAPDVQDVMISMVVALLNHKNPYTGMTYARDPALAYLEVQNEDDIFFYTFSAMDKCPTYKQAMRERFGGWLQSRYKTQDALAKAWGTALGDGKVGGAVDFQTNPWFFGDDNIARQTDAGATRRLLDNALFFHSEQNTFYSKFTKAVRAAGYQGPITGSPWQAPSSLPDLLNLRSDAMTGIVDRHNYFGGEWTGLFDTMLSKPGSGYLGSGLQQVAGHPFALSEWCHVYPETLSAEGPAIVAAYGLGLQGWDASYEFQSLATNGGFRPDAGHGPWDVWNTDVPSQIGQFPALSRMILRGDVKQGDAISTRRVSLAQLQDAKFDFSSKLEQKGDVKVFGGTVPPEALAAGRVLVQFEDETKPSTFPDMKRFGTAAKRIVSNTKQLTWDYAGKGYFTIATPGTVGVVGFAQGVAFKASGVQIQLKSRYASTFVTAMESGATLADCASALITIVARQSNTGFQYFSVDNHVLENGKAPIMVEGVQAALTFSGRPVKAVNILDQDGRAQPNRTIKVSPDGSFSVDTSRDKTLYYQVVFQ